MRISFVGNSHLGTIAPALTKNKGKRHVSHFISRTYGTVPALLVSSSAGESPIPHVKLEPESRYGSCIDLDKTDVVVTVGFNFSLVQMVKLWEHFCPVDSVGSYGAPSLNPTLWDAYVDAAFDATLMARTLRELSRMGAKAVAVVPQPAPAQWVSERDEDKFTLYRNLVRSGDWARVRRDFDRQVRRIEDMGAHVFPQPVHTLSRRGFTLSHLAMGDPADTSENSFYTRGDYYHMNREFAGHVATELYRWLDQVYVTS